MKVFSKGDKVQLNGSEGTSRVGVVTNVYRDGYVTTHELWWAKVMWETLQPYPTSKHPHEELRHAAENAALRNHCQPWTQDEDDKLMRAVRKCERRIDHLAFMHGRTEIAITSRLRKLCQSEADANQRAVSWRTAYADGKLFDYIRDQRSGFTRRAVRALWSDPGYVERQTAYKQAWFDDPIKLKAKLSFTQMVPPCADFAGIEARVLAGMGVPPVDAITKDGVGIDFKYSTPGPRQWGKNAQLHAYQQAAVHAMIHGTGRIKLFAAEPVSTTKEEKPTMNKFYIVVSNTSNLPLSKADALAHAEERARNNPSGTFYVMEAVQAVSLVQPKVAITTLKAPKVVRAKRKAKRSK